ncbi:transglutaminase-like domain-containing protein [Paenibacillus sp. CF384]|uniref:transglutaminase-like domain-containing protein n=1 Tax=Paenibacillus sp. CF384 TaxID=1884382 RepID=UPI00089BD1BA|nr:transglutaminase-like domain-containing protein [Paenibacillus sp. CF384]SDX68362.1 Transglutaminase-like superfamily protein [Paenibacillus sp. CF384]
MNAWVAPLLKPEPVALMVLIILLGSFIQGMRRGASGSAKHLFFFIWQAVSVVIALVLAGKGASRLSPVIRDWLEGRHIVVPQEELSAGKELWYTVVTSLRDFELLRFGVLFLILYTFVRYLLRLLEPLCYMLYDAVMRPANQADQVIRRGRASAYGKLSGTASRTTGALIGALLGGGRAFLVIAVLFVYVTLAPHALGADAIRASAIYAKTAAELLDPVAGDVLKRGPVITDAVQAEFRRVLQRKYEVIDAAVPANIEAAAAEVTKQSDDDEAKARALYDWIGSRIAYDWDKANNYVEHGVWKEQTPTETFDTRKGVCIDVARLYAVMARSVGLDVRVVTGLGATGNGSYGPHAWNEVRLASSGAWIPLDATWASSGDWFNPAGFSSTHIRET